MISVDLHCPTCHCPSGNSLVVDWPSPLEARRYAPLTCVECGNDFGFSVDCNGMKAYGYAGLNLLNRFLVERALTKILRDTSV